MILTIPENSGRKIKEISKVSEVSTAINAEGVRAATYIKAPITAGNNKVIFKTSVAEFRSKSAANERLIEDFENSATLKTQEIAFMFLVILDNGQEIITV